MARDKQDIYTEKHMNMILDLVDDIIIIHDSEHTIVYMNCAAEKAFGRSLESVIGTKSHALFGNSTACSDCTIKPVSSAPTNAIRRRIIPKTGILCDCSAIPYYDEGQLKFVVQHLVPVNPAAQAGSADRSRAGASASPVGRPGPVVIG